MENQETYGEYMRSNPPMPPKKRGRKPLGKEKLLLTSVYLREYEKQAIIEQYGSVTEAIRQEVLPKLEKRANL